MRIYPPFLFALFLTIRAVAGGGHFEAEILEFSSKGRDEYRMVIMQYSNPYSTQSMKPTRITVHLRHNPSAFGNGMPQVSSENYLKAIDALKAQFKTGGRFLFGIMGSGYEPIPGKKEEFQSNSLAILEESDPPRKVVYSFPRKL